MMKRARGGRLMKPTPSLDKEKINAQQKSTACFYGHTEVVAKI